MVLYNLLLFHYFSYRQKSDGTCCDTVDWSVCRLETHWSPWSEWQAAPTLASNLLHVDSTLRPTTQPGTDQLFNAAILFYKWPRSEPESAHVTWKSYTSLMGHLLWMYFMDVFYGLICKCPNFICNISVEEADVVKFQKKKLQVN